MAANIGTASESEVEGDGAKEGMAEANLVKSDTRRVLSNIV